MSIIDQIDKDIAASMKEGTATRTGVLRLLKSSLKNEQIKLGQEPGDEDAVKVLRREAKQRRDSVEAYQKGGREDLAKTEQAELEIIDGYLPQGLSDEELAKLVSEAITETGATGVKDTGAVIGAVMKRAGGRADGAEVAKLVRQRLQ